ncbi:single-stranded DNA-binding protein [Atopobiaceae bacterium 24-176]
MSINRVIITGNLTRDAELRATQSGTNVLHIGVAVNDRWRNPQTEQWEDRPNYIDCVMFGSRAQSISRFLSKGTKVAIEGRLRWSQWVDRETQKNRSKIEVVVDDIEFMGPRNGEAGAPAGYGQGGYPQGGQGAYQAEPQAPQVREPYASQQPAPQQNWAAATPEAPAPAPQAQPPMGETYEADIPF